MRGLLIAIAFLLSALSPTVAKEVVITLNDEEQRALLALFDQANKYGGLQNAETVIYFVRKLQQPPQAAPTAEPPSTK